MKRSIIAVLALVAVVACRSSQKDQMSPNVATSVTNVPAPAVEAKGTTPPAAALPTPEPAVKVENIPMASAAATETTTTTTTTKPHKKVRKD